MVLALMLLAIICILLAVFTVKKIIEPMSRMLKSGNTYDEIDDIQVENYDPENLIQELKQVKKLTCYNIYKKIVGRKNGNKK